MKYRYWTTLPASIYLRVLLLASSAFITGNWPTYTPQNDGRHTTISEDAVPYGGSYTTTPVADDQPFWRE